MSLSPLTVWSRLAVTCVRSRSIATSTAENLECEAISSSVGERSSSAVSSFSTRLSVRSCWATFAGTRISRPVLSRPRWIDCWIQSVAYVENLKPLRQSNFSVARISPGIASWIRSMKERPRPR